MIAVITNEDTNMNAEQRRFVKTNGTVKGSQSGAVSALHYIVK